MYLKLRSGIRNEVASELVLQVEGHGEIVLNLETITTLHLPRPETVVGYCLGPVADGHDRQIWVRRWNVAIQ